MRAGRFATGAPRRPTWRGPWAAERLVAASGVLLAVGGVAIGLAALMHPGGTHPPGAAELASPSYATWHVVEAIGYACLGASLAGILAFQVRETGAVGLADVAGYVLAATGAFAHAGVQYADGLTLGAVASVIPEVFEPNGDLYGAPYLAGPSALAATTLGAGLVTTAVAGLRRVVLPRGALVALMAGSLLVGLPVQPASPVPWWCVVVGNLAVAGASIRIGRWVWQGGRRPSRLRPLPRGSAPAADEAG